MSLCSCHKLQKNALFALEKVNIALFPREGLIVFPEISDTSRGPIPVALSLSFLRLTSNGLASMSRTAGLSDGATDYLLGAAKIAAVSSKPFLGGLS